MVKQDGRCDRCQRDGRPVRLLCGRVFRGWLCQECGGQPDSERPSISRKENHGQPEQR